MAYAYLHWLMDPDTGNSAPPPPFHGSIDFFYTKIECGSNCFEHISIFTISIDDSKMLRRGF